MTLLPTEVLDQPTSPPLPPSPPLRRSASPSSDANEMTTMCSSKKKTNGRTYVAGWAENSHESRVLVSRSPCRRRRAARRTHDIRSVSWHGRSRRRPGFSPGHCRERRWSLGVSRRRPPGSTASRRLVGCVRGDEEMKRCWFLRFSVLWSGREGKKRWLAFFSSPRCASPPSKRVYLALCVPRIDAVLPRRSTACTSNRGGEAHAALLDGRGRTASMRAAYDGHTDSVRAFRLWGGGDVDRRWVTALLLLYRYWCLSPPMSSAVDGPGGTGDPPGIKQPGMGLPPPVRRACRCSAGQDGVDAGHAPVV